MAGSTTVAVAVSTALAELREKHAVAVARIAEIEGQHANAVQEVAKVFSRLAETERSGAGRSTVGRIEAELTRAKGKTDEPWTERVEGARRRARDAQGEIVRYVESNLIPLVRRWTRTARSSQRR